MRRHAGALLRKSLAEFAHGKAAPGAYRRGSQGVSQSQVKCTFDRLPYGCLLFMYRLDLTPGMGSG